MSEIRRWTENEDWIELIHREKLTDTGEGRYEVLVNFGGPMARTDYHIYARVKKESEGVVTSVEMEGEDVERPDSGVTVAGTPSDYRWIYLGRVLSCRAYRKMTMTAPNGLDGLDRICVLQIPQRLSSGAIERGIRREESGNPEPLSGVPLGGVGAGKIEICRDGLFRNITINGNIDAPIRRSEGTFFAIRAESEDEISNRIISTESMFGLDAVKKLDFNGAYPTALLKVDDNDFPLQVEIYATGTIIPRNVKDSSLPLALFTVRLTNKTGKQVKADAALSVENFLGCGGGLSRGLTEHHTLSEGFYERWEERAGNTEAVWSTEGFAGIAFDSPEKEEKNSEGRYILATDSQVSSYLTGWQVDDSIAEWKSFVEEGEFTVKDDQPSSGERTAGAVAVAADLDTGESREFRFVFAWYTPVFRQSPVMEYGHYYSNDFSSADEVAVYALKEFDRLINEAAEVPSLLRESSVPKWFARTLANDAFVFSTASWLTKDGRFAINEGPTSMFGCMGTLDQKLYANHYYSLFFPELDRMELLGFARAQSTNGGVQHDLGGGHLEIKGQPCGWPDLVHALVILSLKHYQLTGDQTYIDEVYPRLIKALLEYQASQDNDGDGLADSPDVGNTFDSEHFEGVSCYTATLTLTALRALEDLAVRRGDIETAERCRKRFASAKESAVKLLWNGQYFISYFNITNGKANGNCHISQMAGEFYSKLCGLGPVYDETYVHKALASIQQLNYHQGFVFPSNEVTPDGEMASRHMWGWLPHVRVCLGGLPMYFGMADRGLNALERMDRVIGEINRDNRWDIRLFYEPDTGREHWGRFYMSAPATWYCYQALLGYRWDAPAGTLSLSPNVPDEMLPFEAPVFLPGFWGWLKISDDRREMSLRIIKRFDNGIIVRRINVPASLGIPILFADGDEIAVKSDPVLHDGYKSLFCEIDLNKVGGICLNWS